MLVKIAQSVGGQAMVTDATMLIVEDHFGNPVVVIREPVPDAIEIVTAADQEEFNSVLQSLGIHKTVVSDRIMPEFAMPPDARLISGPGVR